MSNNMKKIGDNQIVKNVIETYIGETVNFDKVPARMYNVLEEGKKTILYDKEGNKVTESLHEDSCFEIFNEWIIEKHEDVIKAIYDKSGCRVLSGDNFGFDTKNDYIKSIFPDGKCHEIFIGKKDENGKMTISSLMYNSLYDLILIKNPIIEGLGVIDGKSLIIGKYKEKNRVLGVL